MGLAVALISGSAAAQVTPPPWTVAAPQAAPDPGFRDALKQARLARGTLTRRVAPKYQGNGAPDDSRRFISTQLGPWLTHSRKLHDDAAAHYRRAFELAASAEQRMVTLGEAAEMSLLLAERTYRAGEASMPRNIAQDADLRATFLSALDDALEPMRESAAAALSRCTALSEQSDPKSATARRCGTLRDRPFAVDPKLVATSAEVERGVRQARRRIRQCYEVALKQEPSLAGELTLEIRIGPTGGASDVKTKGSLGGHAVAACIAGVVQALPFPAPAKGKKLEVKYPLKLEPGR